MSAVFSFVLVEFLSLASITLAVIHNEQQPLYTGEVSKSSCWFSRQVSNCAFLGPT